MWNFKTETWCNLWFHFTFFQMSKLPKGIETIKFLQTFPYLQTFLLISALKGNSQNRPKENLLIFISIERRKAFKTFLFVSANCTVYFENIQLTSNPINLSSKVVQWNSQLGWKDIVSGVSRLIRNIFPHQDFENVLHLNFFQRVNKKYLEWQLKQNSVTDFATVINPSHCLWQDCKWRNKIFNILDCFSAIKLTATMSVH